MTGYLIFKYLHYVSIFTLFAALVAAHLLIRERVDGVLLRRMVAVDRIYGLSALAVLVVGLVLVFGVGRPALYYAKNWIFHLKVTLFLLAALLSLPQTRFLLKNRRLPAEETLAVPAYLVMLMRVQLVLILLIPLLAVLMANGVGFFE